MKKIIALFAIVSLGFVACNNAAETKEGADAAVENAEAEATSLLDAAGDAMNDAADATGDAMNDAADAVKAGANDATDAVKVGANAAGDAVKGGINDAAKKVEEATK